jgi:hypothetical protein
MTADDAIRIFGECHKRTMRAERRTAMRSALFDLPRRSSLGWEAIHEHGPRLVRELQALAAPEDLGRRMRAAGQRPYQLQAFILICGFLAARQQHLLDAGLAPGERWTGEDPDDVALVADYWARLTGAYRDGPGLLPEDGDGSMRILPADTVAELAEHLRPPADFAPARRMTATLELYSFVLHGEQRDGIFGHGPYALADGATLFVKEYTDLQNIDLPWAATEARNLYPNVIVAYATRGVTVTCDLFGGLLTDPADFSARLEGLAVLTRGEHGVEPVDDLSTIQRAASAAKDELYMRAIGWDETYKIAYGAPLFANHIAPLFALAGEPGAYPRIAAAFEATAERMVEPLRANDVPSVWAHMASTNGPFYWPIAR